MFSEKIVMSFSPNGQKDKISISKVYEFNLSDFVIAELPRSCFECPVGFQCIPGFPCGRNVPYREEDSKMRPRACRLRTLEEYLSIKG